MLPSSKETSTRENGVLCDAVGLWASRLLLNWHRSVEPVMAVPRRQIKMDGDWASSARCAAFAPPRNSVADESVCCARILALRHCVASFVPNTLTRSQCLSRYGLISYSTKGGPPRALPIDSCRWRVGPINLCYLYRMGGTAGISNLLYFLPRLQNNETRRSCPPSRDMCQLCPRGWTLNLGRPGCLKQGSTSCHE
jgi:hypothetical protein